MIKAVGSQWLERRPFWQWVSLLTVIGLLLRLPNLGRDSLWLDEAISYLATDLTLFEHLSNQLQDPHPPFYYLLLTIWRIVVPDNDFSLRLLSTLCNLLLIPVIAYFALDLFKHRSTALLAAVMVTLSPFHILYSHELRMYTLLMFLVTFGTWVYWQARRRSRWWWGGVGVIFLGAVYTHLFAIFALGGINLHALLEADRRKIFPRVFIISLILGLLFIPWGVTIFAETQPELGSLRPLNQSSPRNPIKPLTTLAFLLLGVSNNIYYSAAAFFICLAFLVVLLLESKRLNQEGTRSGWRLVMIQIGIILGVPLLVYTVRPFFLPERTMAAASPFLILLLAWAISRRQSPLPYLTGFMVILMTIGVFLYHFGDPLKPRYRDVLIFVSDNFQEGDVVVHTSDGSYLPGLRYGSFESQRLLANDPDPRKPVEVFELMGGEIMTKEDVLDQNGRLWLIVALEHSVKWQQEQANYFATNLPLISQTHIDGIIISLYDLDSSP